MKQEDIGRFRLIRLGFDADRRANAAPSRANAASVAASLGVMQAQDYHSLLWSLGSRIPESTKLEMEGALGAKEVVRTWLFRGTLHLTASDDLRWMLALVAPRLVSQTLQRRKALGLRDEDFALSKKTLVAALGGGKALSRSALLGKLQEAGLSTEKGRGYHLIFRASIDGVICQGRPNGTEQDFVLLDEWVPGGLRFQGEEAFAELALRYFSSHGPATIQDFIGWTALTAREARAGLTAVGDKLRRVVVADTEYWMGPDDFGSDDQEAAGVFLTAGFDEFILGYKDRGAVLESAFADRICPGGNGVFSPTVISGGRVVGTWKRTLKKGAVVVKATPFTDFGAKERDGIAAAAERYAHFLDLPLRLDGI